ncbi:hypothetical protein [uncultured Ilyobacter sp.]|uniref:hypothetical protein n=1 Tax=uncultured Ilyobacter sp. TaxID=544433 RepID=UPI002AA8400B|nr:hypothetical protein [uncultured Ilyobacter sp.]
MKKIGVLFLLSVLMLGCVSAKMRTRQDIVTGNTIYYGYSWTTGSKDVTHDFNKTTDLSATLVADPIKNTKRMDFSVMKMKGIGTLISLIESKQDEFVEKLNGKEAYTIDVKNIKITNGTDEFFKEDVGPTKKEYSPSGTPFGNSTVNFLIEDSDLPELEKIYKSERVILIATDIYGKEHLGIVKDKTGILELIEFLK